MNEFWVVVRQNWLVEPYLIVASIILTRHIWIRNTRFLVPHLIWLHMCFLKSSQQCHIVTSSIRSIRVRDSTHIMWDVRAECKHLIVARPSQNVKEFAIRVVSLGSTHRRLAANGGDWVLNTCMVMHMPSLAVLICTIWSAAECISGITRARMMEQRIVALVDADLTLSLKTVPAVQHSIISWIVVVWVVVEVARRHIVYHRNKRWPRIDYCCGLLWFLRQYTK